MYIVTCDYIVGTHLTSQCLTFIGAESKKKGWIVVVFILLQDGSSLSSSLRLAMRPEKNVLIIKNVNLLITCYFNGTVVNYNNKSTIKVNKVAI